MEIRKYLLSILTLCITIYLITLLVFSVYIDKQVVVILGVSVTISEPAGGEIWTGGTPHYIIWSITGGVLPYKVTLEYYHNDTYYSIDTISQNSEGSNTYRWYTPKIDDNNVVIRIRVEDSSYTPTIGNATSNKFAIDSTPPHIRVTHPVDNEVYVPINARIAIKFSEPMNHTSVENSFSIIPPVSGIRFLWLSDETCIIKHNNFNITTTYTCTLANSTAKDQSDPGNYLDEYCWNFSTASTADDKKPQIFNEHPSGETYEKMPEIGASYKDDHGVLEDSVILTLDGKKMYADADPDSVSYIPQSSLALGIHKVYVEVEDFAGNMNSTTWEFVVLRSDDPPKIKHTPVKIAPYGKRIYIIAQVFDDVGVAKVILYYKKVNATTYVSSEMSSNGTQYSAIIPADFVREDIHYYIKAVDTAGNEATAGTAEKPYLIKVVKKEVISLHAALLITIISLVAFLLLIGLVALFFRRKRKW